MKWKIWQFKEVKKLKKIDIFAQRKLTAAFIVVLFFIGYFVSAYITNFRGPIAAQSVPGGIIWLFQQFVPTERAIGYLPVILKQLLDTVFISIAATMIASVFSLFIAIIGSRETGVNAWTQIAAKIIASVFRNIPIVAWSIMLILSFRQSQFTGFLALFFTTFGHMTRAFMETIDETSSGTIEALEATGGSYFHIIFQGVIPTVSAQMISWLLYMIENNVRDATLVGILTGTGIGFQFDIFYKSFRYDAAGMVILVLMCVVIGIELVSNKVRRVIL